MSAGFDFGPRRHPRKLSLTPMIDVVFLLLIFFMLASRFGITTILPITGGTAGAGAEWRGPPRLVEVSSTAVALNGVTTAEARLAEAVAPLLPSPDAPVILRASEGTDLQRLVTVIDLLRAAGIGNLILLD